MRSAVFVLAVASTLRLLAQSVPATNMGGRAISLVPGDSKSESSVENLTTKNIQLKPGQSVQEVLQGSGVEPNSDALSVVYSLNPGIYKLTDASNYTVRIPALKDFDPSNTTPVTLVVDSGLKQSIAAKSGSLALFTSTKPPDMRGSLSPVAAALRETSVSIGVHPTSSSFLEQVEHESNLLSQFSAKTNLTEADKATIAEINNDLRAKNKALQADEPDPDVVVRTLAAKDQSEVRLLTICYAPVFLDSGSCDAEFERPSSPTNHRLPVANYHMWATTSLGVRVSQVKRVEVRDSTTVVLVVKQ